ncbi:U32 family peptidase [Candidatus Micrarchaeota archaeon]|nr:U32 family peptidase [Candidatus Micrarchaeota archaeon]
MAIELLAPAGSPASLRAVVEAGADSVYMGAGWNARMRARNFSIEELGKAIAYSRKNGVKSYIVLNTIIFENEISSAWDYIKKIYEFGADALIVQDLGVGKIAREIAPEMELHASTQMSVHNSKTAEILKKMGYSRIVLARELSIDQAKAIKRNANVEVEVFAHGAMCYSYSGKCLFSFIQTGRSGNRGACAQMCRFPWKLLHNGKEVRKGYLTSTKDLNILEHIDKVKRAGIDAIKIEGRLKGAEYVKAVVSAYRKGIDNGEYCDLTQYGLRDYTSGYLFGEAKTNKLTNPKKSGFSGKRIGEVIGNSGEVRVWGLIKKGDLIRTANSGKKITIFRIFVHGREVEEARGECKLAIRSLKKGDVLFKVERMKFEDDFLGSYCALKSRVPKKYVMPMDKLELRIKDMIFASDEQEALAVPKGKAVCVPWETDAELVKRCRAEVFVDTPRIVFDDELDAVLKKIRGFEAGFMVSELALSDIGRIVVSHYANVSNSLAAREWMNLGKVEGVVSSVELMANAAKRIGFINYTGNRLELMISENNLFKDLEVDEKGRWELKDPKGNKFRILKRNGRTVVIS